MHIRGAIFKGLLLPSLVRYMRLSHTALHKQRYRLFPGRFKCKCVRNGLKKKKIKNPVIVDGTM